MLPVTDANPDALSAPLVLVEFTARWCPPCRAMIPHLEAVAAKYGDALRVLACDVEHSPALARRFHVTGTPTFVVLRDGALVDRRVGAMPRAALEAMVARAAG